MDVAIDRPQEIRPGEEIDVAAVETFIRDSLPDLSGEIRVSQFPSGFSNLTYLVEVGERELVLRRPPFGRKAKTAHDMGREYRVLKALKPVFPYCPAPLVYTEDTSIIGSPFYLMERIKGVILRKDPPRGFSLPPEQIGGLCHNMIDVFCELHSVSYAETELSGYGKPEGYVRRQVEGWSKRYRDARTPDSPDFEEVMRWLHDNMPPDTDRPTVIHNDYKFDNLVLDPEDPLRIVGVLDWEMTTIGDPLMDLGASLAYWIDPDDPEEVKQVRQQPTLLPGMLNRQQVVDLYAEISGRKLEPFDFYRCFGLFRLAVIAQQIYYRYYHGQTRNENFGSLGPKVGILERVARRLIAEY
jgi:aminoglycoside phosphotransferase (APT) family kinase protein